MTTFDVSIEIDTFERGDKEMEEAKANHQNNYSTAT
jgi:hypothetical protein